MMAIQYTFMQNNGWAHKSTFTKSCLDTKGRRDVKVEFKKVKGPIT